VKTKWACLFQDSALGTNLISESTPKGPTSKKFPNWLEHPGPPLNQKTTGISGDELAKVVFYLVTKE